MDATSPSRTQYTGYAMAFGCYLSSAIGSVLLKVFLDASSVGTAMLLWYLSGSIWLLAIFLYRRKRIEFHTSRQRVSVYGQISVAIIVALIAWFLALKFVGPSVTAFVSQLGIVFSVLLGAFALGERITPMEVVGGALAIFGALAITYRGGEATLIGAAFALASALFGSWHNFLIKKNFAQIDTLELLLLRTMLVCFVAPLLSPGIGGLTAPPLWVYPAIFFTASIGHVLSTLFLYQALGYVDLAKVSVLSVVHPVIVMLASYFILSNLPTSQQLLGSFLILIGVSFILLQPLISKRWASAKTR